MFVDVLLTEFSQAKIQRIIHLANKKSVQPQSDASYTVHRFANQ